MDVFTLARPVPETFRGAVVAIGNFDAVHKGHRALLHMAGEEAKRLGRPLAVLTFEPHPRRVFRPDDPPFRVTPYPEKLERLRETGVDAVFVLPFDRALAEIGAEEFAKKYLRDFLEAEILVTGEDFRFGHGRSGSVEMLRGKGFVCKAIPLVKDERSAAYSASRIRGLIQSGYIEEAGILLGWPWEIMGGVEKGDQRGRTLGYPTANVPLGETIHPAYGVYAAWVRREGEELWHRAATNIGVRPMFEVKTALVEAHILDFSDDLYGRTLHIRPVRKIRDEKKFGSLDDLKAGIAADCALVRDVLSRDLEKDMLFPS